MLHICLIRRIPLYRGGNSFPASILIMIIKRHKIWMSAFAALILAASIGGCQKIKVLSSIKSFFQRVAGAPAPAPLRCELREHRQKRIVTAINNR